VSHHSDRRRLPPRKSPVGCCPPKRGTAAGYSYITLGGAPRGGGCRRKKAEGELWGVTSEKRKIEWKGETPGKNSRREGVRPHLEDLGKKDSKKFLFPKFRGRIPPKKKGKN